MSEKRAPFTFIRPEEAQLIKDTADSIHAQFGQVRWLEIGVFGGGSVQGIADYCAEKNYPLFAAGVDFEKYRPNPAPTPDYAFFAGDSMDQHRNIGRADFNFLFVDACHCVVHSSQDFLNYAPFVQNGGYILFHDTALPIGKYDQEDWPQDHAYAGQANSKLGVREGLKKLGLLDGRRSDFEFIREVESDNGLMGMMLYRRVLPY